MSVIDTEFTGSSKPFAANVRILKVFRMNNYWQLLSAPKDYSITADNRFVPVNPENRTYKIEYELIEIDEPDDEDDEDDVIDPPVVVLKTLNDVITELDEIQAIIKEIKVSGITINNYVNNERIHVATNELNNYYDLSKEADLYNQAGVQEMIVKELLSNGNIRHHTNKVIGKLLIR